MTRNTWILLVGGSSFGIASCGVWTPQYIDYTSQTGTTTFSAACTEALAEFSMQIEPALEKSCIISGCHASTTIGNVTMAANSAENNRKGVLAYSAGGTDKFYNHYATLDGLGHLGGDVSASLPKANVDAWLAKEAACK